MDEGPPNIPPIENLDEEEKFKQEQRERMIAFALELNESQESFPFPGIHPESYSTIKGEEESLSDYENYATPIDDLLRRFTNEGMKIVLGSADRDSINFVVIPGDSDDAVMDSLLPRHLLANDSMDGELRELILRQQDYVS